MGETDSPQQEADLPRSGQAFLWASMLRVLFKADSLHQLEELAEIEEEEFFEEEFFESVERRSLPANLEQHLRRRTSVKHLGQNVASPLQELIEQLEHIAAEIEAAATDGSPPPFPTFSQCGN